MASTSSFRALSKRTRSRFTLSRSTSWETACAVGRSRVASRDLTMRVRQWCNNGGRDPWPPLARLGQTELRVKGALVHDFACFSRVISNPLGRLLSLAAVPLVAPIRGGDREKLRWRF